jgi:hypothetical protein
VDTPLLLAPNRCWSSCVICLFQAGHGGTGLQASNAGAASGHKNTCPSGVAASLLQEIVRRMLTRDPSARATATEVLNHPWVKEDGVAGDVEIEPEVCGIAAHACWAGHCRSCMLACASHLMDAGLCFCMRRQPLMAATYGSTWHTRILHVAARCITRRHCGSCPMIRAFQTPDSAKHSNDVAAETMVG